MISCLHKQRLVCFWCQLEGIDVDPLESTIWAQELAQVEASVVFVIVVKWSSHSWRLDQHLLLVEGGREPKLLGHPGGSGLLVEVSAHFKFHATLLVLGQGLVVSVVHGPSQGNHVKHLAHVVIVIKLVEVGILVSSVEMDGLS